MSEKKALTVRASDAVFARLGASFVLEAGGCRHAFRHGSPGRMSRRFQVLVNKVDAVREHSVELTAEEAEALRRDGYEVLDPHESAAGPAASSSARGKLKGGAHGSAQVEG